MVSSFLILYLTLIEHYSDLMELSCKFEDFVLLSCKQVVKFYCLDLGVVERVIDLVFVEMEKKVVDFHFELELEVTSWFEGSIVVENLDKMVDMLILRISSIRILPSLIPRLWLSPRLSWHRWVPIIL